MINTPAKVDTTLQTVAGLAVSVHLLYNLPSQFLDIFGDQ